MKNGEKVNHAKYGQGIILNVTEKHYVVDFNGEEKTLLKAFTKFESVEKTEKRIAKKIAKTAAKNVETKLTLKDVYSSIVGSSEERCSNWMMIVNTSAIMQKADEVGSFVSKIVEDAINGKNVTEKQAWAVAYFAKNNNLINA